MRPAYVYAPTDFRPRQPREKELCEQAASTDWLYIGATAAGTLGGIYANTQYLKHSGQPGVRLTAPAIIGFFWGGFLGGGYLSLPKCDPTWAYGPPPEGDVRASWPLATAVAVLATVTAPAMDYAFLGPVPLEWPVYERSMRVFIAMGSGLVGSLLPYVLPPKTWRAKKEIERLRLEGAPGVGAMVGYGFAF